MSDNTTTRETTEPVACRCGKCLGLVDVDLSDKAHPRPRVGVTGTAEGGDDPKMLLYDLWITWNKLHHESNQVAARIAAIAASTPTRGSDE